MAEERMVDRLAGEEEVEEIETQHKAYTVPLD